jgi:signal transduction histidine kinase
MSSTFTAPDTSVTGRIEQVSGIRPVTLLIAFGIVLITAILIATGIAANGLRQQAIAATESELGRIGTVLAAAGGRSLKAVDAQLADIAERIGPVRDAGGDGLREAAARPETVALLRSKLGHFPALAGVALITADGTMLDRAGAWPDANTDWDELLAALRARPDHGSSLGAPIRDPQGGAVGIPLAHRIEGPQGVPVGAIVGLIPVGDLVELFAAATLAPDATIVLLRSDGRVLARFPEQAGTLNHLAKDSELSAILHDVTATMVRGVLSPEGAWRIETLRALADYPAAVMISRSADEVLAGWARQGSWFVGFAGAGAVAIGVMVCLIARQFRGHAALAAMRAEKIEMERAQLAAEAELLKAERLSVLGQLTATVAHELRNPLSAIRNTLFTVKELATAAAMKLDRPIARMERSIERCDRIISDLLEYTRNRELNRDDIAFDRWLGEVLAEQQLVPPVVLTAELDAAKRLVSIDPDRFRRVVINLVDNAAQALAQLPADHDKRITVRTAVVDGDMILAIEDTGPGISPENLGRIFEPLFSTKSFGTGLGLPTVKQIINQHDGTIAIDSEVGQGTRVTVCLPLAAEAVEELRAAA